MIKMKTMKREKKGELTSEQIITIILALIGAGLLIFLYYQLSWSGTIDRQTCHESVVLRGTIDIVQGALQDAVPLKCKTEKTCVTSGFFAGKCREFENSKGITNVKAKSKEQVEKTIAQNVVDCWSMMGEGHLSLFSQTLAKTYGIGSVYPTCVICNRIAFDKDKLANSGIDLNKIDVENYMSTRLLPDKNITYAQYLNKEGVAKISIDEFALKELNENEKKEPTLVNAQNVQLQQPTGQGASPDKELVILFMQISAPKGSEVLSNTLGTLAIGGGGSFILSKKITTATLKSPWSWAIAAILGVYQQGSVAYNQAVTAGYCGDVGTGNNVREGCSVVRVTSYEPEEISKYCSIIESIS